jgi:hypothetical protein
VYGQYYRQAIPNSDDAVMIENGDGFREWSDSFLRLFSGDRYNAPGFQEVRFIGKAVGGGCPILDELPLHPDNCIASSQSDAGKLEG